MARPLPKVKAKVGLTKNVLKARINTFKRKQYVINGRIVSLQGHEHFGLKDIIRRFGMSIKDIVYKASEMPKITYRADNQNHRYIPDFWIPKRNLIIEIKSKYTFEKNQVVNILKAVACIEAGYDFQVWIYNRKGTLEHILKKSVFV